MTIRVGIVDDHKIVRDSLRGFLAEVEDFKVVGEAADGRTAVELVRHTPMDVLLLDLAMPGQGAIDALAMIQAKAPDVKIVVLSGQPEEQFAIKLFRQGVRAYVSKGDEPAQIINAVRSVAGGRAYFTPKVAELMAAQEFDTRGKAPHDALTQREFQILLRIAKGQSLEQISNDLSLSSKTISTYRTHLCRKLGATSNTQLTLYALRHALID